MSISRNNKRILSMIVGSLAWASSNAFIVRSSSSTAWVRRQASSTFIQGIASHRRTMAGIVVPSFTRTTRFSNQRILQSAVDDDTTTTSTEESSAPEDEPSWDIPIYRSEGLLAVEKPLDWTSSDVVSYIRGMLERDAKNRGSKVVSVRSRRNKSRKVKVGHGGTLDPLATGVLVIGVGKGTKELQQYLTGSKAYRAVGEFGFETTTLDMEGNVTQTGPLDHITLDSIDQVLPDFTGKIMQIPPIFSALRKDGKKLYQSAREGMTTDDIDIEAREVEIIKLNLVRSDDVALPKFEIAMECGGGTYVRSLIRDIGYKLDTFATTTLLERTKQAQFTLEDCLPKSEWNADNIYAEIDKRNKIREAEENDSSPE